MFFELNKKKNRALSFLTALIILSVALLSLFGCGKKPEEKPQPTPSEEKRICSFSISNLDSEFPVDDVSITVPYGINSVTVSLEDYKAGFIISKNDGSRAVLQIVENLENDDYSFIVSDGNYIYKKETVLHPESSFFSQPEGEFSICLCLFDKDDVSYENPSAGYQYRMKYTVSDGKITFEAEGGSVIRNH